MINEKLIDLRGRIELQWQHRVEAESSRKRDVPWLPHEHCVCAICDAARGRKLAKCKQCKEWCIVGDECLGCAIQAAEVMGWSTWDYDLADTAYTNASPNRPAEAKGIVAALDAVQHRLSLTGMEGALEAARKRICDLEIAAGLHDDEFDAEFDEGEEVELVERELRCAVCRKKFCTVQIDSHVRIVVQCSGCK